MTPDLRHELWLAGRLKQQGADISQIFVGVTDTEKSCERMRKAITEAELSDVIVGKHEGKPETYRSAFARLYGCEL